MHVWKIKKINLTKLLLMHIPDWRRYCTTYRWQKTNLVPPLRRCLWEVRLDTWFKKEVDTTTKKISFNFKKWRETFEETFHCKKILFRSLGFHWHVVNVFPLHIDVICWYKKIQKKEEEENPPQIKKQKIIFNYQKKNKIIYIF